MHNTNHVSSPRKTRVGRHTLVRYKLTLVHNCAWVLQPALPPLHLQWWSLNRLSIAKRWWRTDAPTSSVDPHSDGKHAYYHPRQIISFRGLHDYKGIPALDFVTVITSFAPLRGFTKYTVCGSPRGNSSVHSPVMRLLRRIVYSTE